MAGPPIAEQPIFSVLGRYSDMKPTMILYANPETFRILSEKTERFSGTRRSFRERLYAAWLVFSGRADALSWEEYERWQRSQLAQ